MTHAHDISRAIARIRSEIQALARRHGRDPATVALLAVSKTKPAAAVEAAAASGQRRFGENHLQDAMTKVEALRALALEWHFIGALQSNKTRPIAENFDWVHSVDRARLATRLNDQRPDALAPLNVCLQVNIDGEDSKAGVTPAALPELAAHIATLPHLRLRGLMAIPRPQASFEEQRVPHRALRMLFEQTIDHGHPLDTLSMGMTNDMEAAIAEGSTMVRIGTAIFGARQP